MKMVYFYDGSSVHRFVSLGQIVTILQSCYFKGLELGYNDIYLEWHNQVTYPNWDNYGRFKGILHKPKDGFLPIKFLRKNRRMDCDSIDISQPNILYDGCEPILSNPMNQKPHLSFLNKYFMESKNRPVLNIPKESSNKYILFHYRHSEQDRQIIRNTPFEEWKRIFTTLKDNLKGYKFIKIGEESEIDNEFDEVKEYFPYNLVELFRYINNASLIVCSPSGPLQITYLLGKEGIILSNPSFDNSNSNWESNKYYGNSSYDWVDRSKYLHFKMEDYKNINEHSLLDFCRNIRL